MLLGSELVLPWDQEFPSTYNGKKDKKKIYLWNQEANSL